MQLDQLRAKFHFKSYLNQILINFYDPIPAVRFTRRDDSIQIRTIYIESSSMCIENWSNLIEIGQK